MASVQVRILQSGRTDAYGLPLVPGSVATVERSYAVGLVYSGFASWMNPADAYDGETNLRKPDETYTLYQSGTAFGILPGDGGANGLTFSDAIGNFTVSAAVITGFGRPFRGGGYCYFPAGAGGLLTDGWYWTVMDNDDGTAGRVYADKYEQGTGTPLFITSPTSLSGLTTGRITQTTSEITAQTFTAPGGSIGPNGLLSVFNSRIGDTSASAKRLRLRIAGTEVWLGSVTSSPVLDNQINVRNLGVQTRQSNIRITGYGSAATTTISTQQFSAIDMSADAVCTVTMQVAANTSGMAFFGTEAIIKYGA